MKSLLFVIFLGNVLTFVVSASTAEDPIAEKIDDVTDILSDKAEEISNLAEDASDHIKEAVEKKEKRVADGISNLVEGAADVLDDKASKAEHVAKKGKEVADEISNLAEDAADSLGDQTSQAEHVKKSKKDEKNADDVAVKDAEKLLENTVSQMEAAVKEKVNFVGNMAKEVEKSAGYIGEGMKIVGDLVDKKREGITETFDELKNAARVIGRGADSFDGVINSVHQEKESLTKITLHVVGNAEEEKPPMKARKKTLARVTRHTKKKLKVDKPTHGTHRCSKPLRTAKPVVSGNKIGSARDTNGVKPKLPESRKPITTCQDKTKRKKIVKTKTLKDKLEHEDRIVPKKKNPSADGKRGRSKIHPMIFVGEPIVVDQVFIPFDDLIWDIVESGESENGYHNNKNQSKKTRNSYVPVINKSQLKSATKTESCKIHSEVKCKRDKIVNHTSRDRNAFFFLKCDL